MKTIFILIFVLSLFSFSTCDSVEMNKINGKKDKIAVIKTKYGDIKIKLYEETPLHSENFIKLTESGFYDNTLFHRVIPEFMIQGGDPDSKNAKPGIQLGNGGPDYTIKAEFVDKYFHKRGAVAAARMGDDVNPEKESSGSQFYIVQGAQFTDQKLDQIEKNVNNAKKRDFFMKYIEEPQNAALKSKIDSLQAKKDMQALQKFAEELQLIIDSAYIVNNKIFKFSAEQRQVYKTIGGAPHLDGSYTVFGEVIEGMNIVDSIAKCERDKMDRPIEDIVISISRSKK